MAYNNRLLHTCVCVLTRTTLECALVEMNTMRTVAHAVFPMAGYDKKAASDAMIGFIKANGIEREINLHLIIDEPVHASEIYEDSMYGFAQCFKLRAKRSISVSSFADMLAYRQWNMIGLGFRTVRMRDEWSAHSRIAMLYVSMDNANMSMVNNGDIIDGLGSGEYRRYTKGIGLSHVLGNPSPNAMQDWKESVEGIVSMMFETMHADYTYIYLDPHVSMTAPLDTGIIKTRYVGNASTTTFRDITEAVVMADSYYDGDHYYMRVAKGDYQDVSVEIEDDDGTVRSMPVFQH